MVGRYLIALALAAVVTVGVLFTMQVLVASPQAKLEDSGPRHFVDFVRVQRDESVQRKERRREKPKAPDMPPPQTSTTPRTDNVNQTQISVAIPSAPMGTGVAMDVSGLDLVAGDGEYLPLAKVPPEYPRAAQSRKISGYCLVEYTVTTAGTTKDIKVIDADPPGIFNKASIQAAKRFKYEPRRVNGEPVEVMGVRNLFKFELK